MCIYTNAFQNASDSGTSKRHEFLNSWQHMSMYIPIKRFPWDGTPSRLTSFPVLQRQGTLVLS